MKKQTTLFKGLSRGFTLVEVLVVVLIMAILVTMAVPMYERTVEKSRLAEVSALLKRLHESKLRTMDARNIDTFTSGAFTKSQLDMTVPAEKDFSYGLRPGSYPNAVCAVRKTGDAKDTKFLYLGESAPEYCNGNNSALCAEYRSSGRKLFCSGNCDVYGLNSYTIGTCSN